MKVSRASLLSKKKKKKRVAKVVVRSTSRKGRFYFEKKGEKGGTDQILVRKNLLWKEGRTCIRAFEGKLKEAYRANFRGRNQGRRKKRCVALPKRNFDMQKKQQLNIIERGKDLRSTSFWLKRKKKTRGKES